MVQSEGEDAHGAIIKFGACFKYLVLVLGPDMNPIDALWHVLNLFAPAVGVGLISTVLAKLVWYRSLKGVAWIGLCLWSCGAASVALLAGLVVFDADGRMLTYAAMVVATALGLLWAGWGPGRRA